MKEFDSFESSIKKSVENFNDIQPGKMLWFRINMRLFFGSLIRKYSLLIGLISFILLVGFISLVGINRHYINSTGIVLTKTTNKRTHNKLFHYKMKRQILSLDNPSFNNNTISALSIENSYTQTGKLDNTTTDGFSYKYTNSSNYYSANTTVKPSIHNKPNKAKHKTENKMNKYASLTKGNTSPESTSHNKTNNATKTPARLQTTSVLNKQQRQNSNTLTKVDYSESFNNKSADKIKYSIVKMKLIQNSRFANSEFENPKYLLINNRKRGLYYDYELFMGPNLNYSRFTLNPNNSSDKELNKSSLLPSYHFGANYNLYYKNWFVRTGINYSTLKEQINYNTTSMNIDEHSYYYTIITRNYRWDTTGWNTNIAGAIDSIPIVRLIVTQSSSNNSITEYDTSITTQNLQYNNTYSSINIPLLLGRRFNFDLFSFDVATGISWSHINTMETHVLDPKSGEVYTLNNHSKDIKKDVFNGVLAIGIGYRLNGFNTLFLKPELQYNFNSIFDRTNFNKYKVYQIRISIGLRYQIK